MLYIEFNLNRLGMELLKDVFMQTDSSVIFVKAIAASFRKDIISPVKISGFLKPLASIVNTFSEEKKISLVERTIKGLGISDNDLKKVTSESASKWVISQYSFSKDQKLDHVFIGAPSGGVTHLAALYNAPFLTQHFLIAVSQFKNPDDIKVTLEQGIKYASSLIKNDPNIDTIIHYDPVHDRFLVKYLNTIRFKLQRLTNNYKEFMLKHLKSQGNIVFFDVKYMWKQYKIDENIYFQVGGLGELKPFEYIMGSDRIIEWITNLGVEKFNGWHLEDYQLVERPESEWGTIDGLKEDVKEFAEEHGFTFIEIQATHPEKISELATLMYTNTIERQNKSIKNIYFDCFTAINPTFNLLTSTPPIWLPFNCRDSYLFAKRFLEKHKSWILKHRPDILFTSVPSYIKTLDLVLLHDWELLFSQYGDLKLIGVSRKYYPMDVSYPFQYPSKLKGLMKKLYDPIKDVPSIFDLYRVQKEYYLDINLIPASL